MKLKLFLGARAQQKIFLDWNSSIPVNGHKQKGKMNIKISREWRRQVHLMKRKKDEV